MKVILEYDPLTGFITDAAGMMLISYISLNHFGAPNEGYNNSRADDVKFLLAQGATVKDVLEMKKEGLL